MSFFKNTQVAKLFKVSNTTVTNWIEAAEKGKINLDLTTIGSRKVIIDSSHNREMIRNLVNKGKKHVGRSSRVYVKPKPKIYEIFNPEELSEILVSLESSNLLPYKYTFYDKGATLWSQNYEFKKNVDFSSYNMVKDAYKLIGENLDRIFLSLANCNLSQKTVNIIDIGCGNGEPALQFISYLVQNKIKVRYLPVDISESMLQIAKNKVKDRFPEVEVVTIKGDLENYNLSRVLLKYRDSSSINFLMMLGILGNYKAEQFFLRRIRSALSKDDHLLLGSQILSDFLSLQPYNINSFHVERTEWILDLLGLKDLYYSESIIQVHSDKNYEYRSVKFNKDVTLTVDLDNKSYEVEFRENDKIVLYEFKYLTELKIIEMALKENLSIEYFTTNTKRNYAVSLFSITKKYV